MQTEMVLNAPHDTGRFAFVKWSIFSILICTYILVYFHRMAPGVVSEFLMADFQITGAKLGSLSAVYFIIYACMQLPSGVLADTLGTRTSLVAGNLVAGLGSLLFGMAGSFEMAYLGRFFVGLGVSVVFVSIMKNNAVWFHERVFALMSGVTLLIGNMGSILAAGPFAQLLNFFQWRTIFMAIGALSLLLSLLSFFIVRNKPEDMGFASPNQYRTGNTSTPQTHWLKSLASVMKIRSLWPGFLVQFGMIGSLYSFMGLWGIPYLRDVHTLERTQAADYMTAMLLSFAVGSLFFGWFSDRCGKRKPVLIASITAFTLLWAVMMFTHWTPGIPGFLLFGGLGFAGSGFVLTFACAKEISHPNLSGMAVSVVNCGSFAGASLIQPLFGYIADLTWDGTIVHGIRIYSAADYHNGFLLMLGCIVLALAASLRIPETNCRNIFS